VARFADQPIRVDGMRELQAALKAVDGEAQKELRVVGNEVAELIVSGAQRLVARRSGRARGSIRAQSGQREVRISAGGGRAPYYAWLDFGGNVGRKGSVGRAFLRDGRYLYPTYQRRRAELVTRLERGLAALVARAGLEVA
jgi:hypothetical protein